ncbi:hypothetical protein ILYODFUR_011389 [Ilyodon furcidens]|uniref:Uncharacterized protein n=1 Tax=Ilyodon furcidens TaxID=33524 RepID=A0ABV0V2B1_9TELE
MVLGAPPGFAADWTGADTVQGYSLYTALGESIGGEVSSIEQQQLQKQGMIQDLKALPNALNSVAIDSASTFSFLCKTS